MKKQTQAPTWQRVLCGLLAAAMAPLLMAMLMNTWPDALHHAARQLLVAYATVAFAHIALTGRLPRILQREKR